MSQSWMRLFICSKKLFDNWKRPLMNLKILLYMSHSLILWSTGRIIKFISATFQNTWNRQLGEHQNNPQQLPILGPYKWYEVPRGCGVVVSVYSFAYLCFATTVSWRLTLCFWSMTTFYDLFIMLFITLQIETQWNCVSIGNIQSTIHRK